METGQNPKPGNSNVDVSADKAESLSDIMNTMDADPKPEATPDDKTDGKDEGKKDSDQVADTPKWISQLDEESRNDADFIKQLSKFQKIGDLAKSYSQLEKKLGNSVNIPSSDAGAEELAAFYQKLGRPESADGYSINDEKAKPFRDLAFMNNLTDAQAKGIYEGLEKMGAELMQSNADQMARTVKESDNVLHSEWGKDYSKNLEFLKRGIATYGGNALGAKLKATGLLYDVDVIKMFAKLGRMSAESTASTKGSGGGMSDYVSTSDGGRFNYKD